MVDLHSEDGRVQIALLPSTQHASGHVCIRKARPRLDVRSRFAGGEDRGLEL